MGHHWPYVPAGSLVERHPPHQQLHPRYRGAASRARTAAPGQASYWSFQHPWAEELCQREAGNTTGSKPLGLGGMWSPGRARDLSGAQRAPARPGRAGRGPLRGPEALGGMRWRRAPRRSGRGGRAGCLRAATSGGGERETQALGDRGECGECRKACAGRATHGEAEAGLGRAGQGRAGPDSAVPPPRAPSARRFRRRSDTAGAGPAPAPPPAPPRAAPRAPADLAGAGRWRRGRGRARAAVTARPPLPHPHGGRRGGAARGPAGPGGQGGTAPARRAAAGAAGRHRPRAARAASAARDTRAGPQCPPAARRTAPDAPPRAGECRGTGSAAGSPPVTDRPNARAPQPPRAAARHLR